MSEWVFTFGSGQRLRACTAGGEVGHGVGLPLGDRYVVIEAEDYMAARLEMIRIFGTAWAAQYESREAAYVAIYNLRQLELE